MSSATLPRSSTFSAKVRARSRISQIAETSAAPTTPDGNRDLDDLERADRRRRGRGEAAGVRADEQRRRQRGKRRRTHQAPVSAQAQAGTARARLESAAIAVGYGKPRWSRVIARHVLFLSAA